jgi:hypothetical protein
MYSRFMPRKSAGGQGLCENERVTVPEGDDIQAGR